MWDIFPKKLNENNVEKDVYPNQLLTIYPCTKFQVIGNVLSFGIKFAQKTWMEKKLENKYENLNQLLAMYPSN